jgi:hypothetical protein
MIAPPFLEIVPLKPRRLWEEKKSSQAFRRVGLSPTQCEPSVALSGTLINFPGSACQFEINST